MKLELITITFDKNNEVEGLIKLDKIQEGDLIFKPQKESSYRAIILSGDRDIVDKSKIITSKLKVDDKPPTIYNDNLLKLSRYSSINIKCYSLLENIPKDYKVDLGLRINITKQGDPLTEMISKVTFDEMCNFVMYQDFIDKDYCMSIGLPLGSCIIRNDKPMKFKEIY